MPLFTLMFEYEGGSYMMQSKSVSIESAAADCISNWCIEDTKHKFSNDEKSQLLAQISTADLFELEGLINTWAIGRIKLRGKDILLKMVKTDASI
ncbi:MAG: hypothetical protein HKN88_02915 [Gammaproteobacteria bacterium]|nr:hypothetical protein [Gammaproteobacteria bacterium]